MLPLRMILPSSFSAQLDHAWKQDAEHREIHLIPTGMFNRDISVILLSPRLMTQSRRDGHKHLCGMQSGPRRSSGCSLTVVARQRDNDER